MHRQYARLGCGCQQCLRRYFRKAEEAVAPVPVSDHDIPNPAFKAGISKIKRGG
jgi:hypothetical protein